MRVDREHPAVPRGLLGFAAVAYVLFVVYGSLVPLEFRALPWDEALAQFRAIPFLQLGIGSRADWVANLLLFIPLTYLWMGVLVAGRSVAVGILATLVVIPAAIVLSVGIEFTQMFFPQRTVSQNDIFAETVGGIVGVLAWWATGPRFVEWLRAWQQLHSHAALAERYAWLYLTGVLVYNVLPLDLTISVVEIFHKFQEGKLNLIPFSRLPADPAYALYELATDALIWTPLALLWRLDGTRSAWRVWSMTMAAAIGLEAMQLFVYSRVSDVTDVFTAAAGAGLGIWVGGRWVRRAERIATPFAWAIGLPFVLAAVWAMGLLLVFWFPFDFQADGAFIKSRLVGMSRVPFETYYFGTEFRAATEVLRKTLFFAPLGGLLAWGVTGLPWRWRAPLFALSMFVLAATPLLVELGQVLLPEKVADFTDAFLAWVGGLTGYLLVRRMLRAPRIAPTRPTADPVRVGPPAQSRGARLHFPLTVAVLALLFWAATQAPFLPYNVRELLDPEARLLSAVLLALACYGLAVWPVWLARRHVPGSLRWAQVPLGMLAYGGASFFLLLAAVPDESLHDVVGSPVLGWPWHWETGLRWMALAAAPGALIYLAAQSARRWRGRRLGAMHFWAALPVLLIAYWGVVSQAATDNLTELLAAPALPAFVALCAAFYCIALAAALLASPQRRWGPVLLACGVSLPLAAVLLHFGLADDIDKYGQRFSALQFLLSPDRANYVSALGIWMRYAMLHLLVIGALASLQWPHFQSARRPSHPAPHETH
ncbi:MAG: VanZ family protein [Gammaproteobacteria bacterium]